MGTIKYYNAHILDKNGAYAGVVYAEDGIISYAGPEDPGLAHESCVDVEGKLLMPALVDLHCHLRDPGFPEKETMKSGMRAALSGGYATLCAMANTNPVIETPAQVVENHMRAEKLGLCRLYQAAAAGVGLGDETPTDWSELSRVTPILSNDGKTITSEAFMEMLLRAAQEYGVIVSTHAGPERETVRRDIALMMRVCASRFDMRCPLHIGHISCAQTADMVRKARAVGLPVTCEITPHHLIGHNMDYKVNPPLRTEADIEGLLEAIVDGTAFCLATDHAPHTQADKVAGMAGISGIEFALGIYMHVFHEHNIPLARLSEMASFNPAERLGLRTGLIAPGYLADLIILDPDWTGELDPDRMLSRSHNNPFRGHPLRGRVLKTIVEGELRYSAQGGLGNGSNGSFIR